MRTIIMCFVVTLSVLSFAQESKTEAARRHFMEATGGFVEKAGSGRVAIVNCQKVYGNELLKECTDSIRELIKVQMDLIEGELNLYTPPKGYEMAVFVVDDEKLPLSLVAVENGWGLVNVAKLKPDEKLFRKQFNRSVALALGGGVSKFTSSVMQPAKGVEGVRKIIGTGVPMDVVGAMRYNLRGHGVTEKVRAIYRQAIAQGWAPQPTNDAQRVIWEQMNAKPTQPLTIKYKKK